MDINEMRRLYREKKAHEEVSSASSNVEYTAHITQLEEGKNSKPTKSGDSSTVSLSEIAYDYEKRVYQDENEVNKLSISDDSITVVRNQEDNIFVFFVNGEVFSGTLWSSDERFEIEIKESEVTFCRCYHKNGFLAIAQNLDDDSNSFYFDDQDNAMDRDAFEKKYGKEFEEIITAGFAELESRIEENTSHDNSTAYSGDSSHLYRNEESLSESHCDSSTDNETDYSVAEYELQFSIDKVREENGYTVVEGCLNSGSICTDYEVDIVRHNGERIRATIEKIATKEINRVY